MDFEALYLPYSGMATIEETFAWLSKRCASLGFPQAVLDAAIQEVFLELAGGLQLATDGGDTGFDDVPHAVLNHYLLKRAMEVNERATTAYSKALNETLNVRLKVEARPIRRLWAKWTS